MDGCMGRWIDVWMDGWVGGWMDGWMGGWMDGWLDGWVDGWMEVIRCMGTTAKIREYKSPDSTTKSAEFTLYIDEDLFSRPF